MRHIFHQEENLYFYPSTYQFDMVGVRTSLSSPGMGFNPVQLADVLRFFQAMRNCTS